MNRPIRILPTNRNHNYDMDYIGPITTFPNNSLFIEDQNNFFGQEGVMSPKILDWIEDKSILLLLEPEVSFNLIENFNNSNNINLLLLHDVNDINNIYYLTKIHPSGINEIRFNDVYNRVIGRILKSDNKENLILILKENLKMSMENNQCVTGKLFSLLSSLSYYEPDMNIMFTPSEIFYSIMKKIVDDYCLNKLYNFKEAKNKVLEHCKNNDKIVKPWLDLLEENRNNYLEQEIGNLFFHYRLTYNTITYNSIYNELKLINKFHDMDELYGINKLRMLRCKLFLNKCNLGYSNVIREVENVSYSIFIINLGILSTLVLKNYISKGKFN